NSVQAEGGPMEPIADRWRPVTRGRDIHTYSKTLMRPQRDAIAINALRSLPAAQRRVFLANVGVFATTVEFILDNTTNPLRSVENIVYLIQTNPRLTPGQKNERIRQVQLAVWIF